MRFLALAGASALFAMAVTGSPATAQDIVYDCQNDRLPLNIPAGSLNASLDSLRLAINCPISGTRLAGKKTGKAVRGRYTPAQALRVMLRGTGLKGQSIRQGLQVSRNDR